MRDPYWDILKGLGIIAVVMGHACIYQLEVNWFHLELFFFVSGFLFNAEKCLDYGNFFLHKLKTLWKPFVMYNALFLVLRNFFIHIHWLAIQPVPEGYAMISNRITIYELPRCISAIIFTAQVESMCGATWFMAPFFVNLLLFAFLVKVSYKKSPWILPLLLTLFFALSVTIVNNSPGMVMLGDMAMFLLPITAAGFYLKKFCSEKNIGVAEIFSKRIVQMGGIIAFIVFAALEHEQMVIYLAGYGMGNWFIFLIAAFSGIYLTMILARIILLSNLLTKIFAYIGRESFHIMALHFVGFKILTSLYVIFSGSDFRLINYYVLPQISPYIYIIFGVGIPLLFRKIYVELKRSFL